MIVPASEAYNKAKSLLERDYGNQFTLSAAFRSKAENWVRIPTGDKGGLRKYSLFLNNCVNVKKSNSDMIAMDNSQFLNILASKLPIAYQQRWINKVGDMREDDYRSPKLEDFEHFVGRISRNENDPRVTGLGYQPRQQQNSQQKPHSVYHPKTSKPATKVLTTQVKVNMAAQTPCLYCHGMHSILHCRKFGALEKHEKSDSVKKKGLCFACLNPGHMKVNCEHIKDWVKCEKCDRDHVTIMHDPAKDQNQTNTYLKTKHSENTNAKKVNSENKVSSGCVLSNSNLLMTMLPVLVKHKSGNDSVATYAFVDNGSAAGFSISELADQLKLTGRSTNVTLKTLNSEQNLKTEILENLQVGNLSGQYLDLPPVYVKNTMPVDISDIPKNSDINKYAHLKHIKLPDISGYTNCIPCVSLIIGVNTPAATTPLEVCTGNIGEPYGIRSPLGWLLYGLPGKISSYSQTISVNFCKIDESLEKQVKKYFDLEFCERISDDRHLPSIEDRQFVKILADSIVLKDGHYETDLPFKDRNVIMPDNRLQAESFAYKLRQKLLKNPDLCERYSDFMNGLELNHYSEKVPQSEINRDDGRVWRITHHSVTHPQKPQKVRVVYNCPLQLQNTSLNDQLLQGPDLANLLIGVLLRWRQDYYAVMSDIVQMFYQCRVSQRDSDMLRYFWWPNGDMSGKLTEYRMLVHIFGAVSSPSSANFILKQTANDNIDEYSSESIKAIINDFYVDDFLKSFSTEKECKAVIQDICEVLAKGGFQLTKWVSNSRNVLASIPEKDLADQVKDLDLSTDSLPMQRALGVQWNVESDSIEFTKNDVNRTATRRNILSVLSSIYDPFGISSPYVLKSKIILQDLCREKLSWDEPIPIEYERQWKKWLDDLYNLSILSIKRCVKPKNFGNIINTQLHHFGDASQAVQ